MLRQCRDLAKRIRDKTEVVEERITMNAILAREQSVFTNLIDFVFFIFSKIRIQRDRMIESIKLRRKTAPPRAASIRVNRR